MFWKRLLICAVLVGATACGPSAAEMRRSQNVTYEATFPVVWNAVQQEVLKRYLFIAEQDAVIGSLTTGWRLIVATNELGEAQGAAGAGQASGGSNNAVGPSTPGGSTVGGSGNNQAPGVQAARDNARTTQMPLIPGLYMRARIAVKGPPWRVNIEGEAVEYKLGMTMLVPFHHGYADEPEWVEPRVEALRYAIYDKLRQYAIDDAPIVPKKVKKNETATWEKLPDPSAAQLIADVRTAAKNHDLPALQARMDPAFTWSAGAEGSAETAIVMWGADPTTLASLVATLDAGCAVSAAAATDVVCPADSRSDAGGRRHAVFRKEGEEWRFVLFVP